MSMIISSKLLSAVEECRRIQDIDTELSLMIRFLLNETVFQKVKAKGLVLDCNKWFPELKPDQIQSLRSIFNALVGEFSAKTERKGKLEGFSNDELFDEA